MHWQINNMLVNKTDIINEKHNIEIEITFNLNKNRNNNLHRPSHGFCLLGVVISLH
jgi:hypothetical protein